MFFDNLFFLAHQLFLHKKMSRRFEDGLATFNHNVAEFRADITRVSIWFWVLIIFHIEQKVFCQIGDRLNENIQDLNIIGANLAEVTEFAVRNTIPNQSDVWQRIANGYLASWNNFAQTLVQNSRICWATCLCYAAILILFAAIVVILFNSRKHWNSSLDYVLWQWGKVIYSFHTVLAQMDLNGLAHDRGTAHWAIMPNLTSHSWKMWSLESNSSNFTCVLSCPNSSRICCQKIFVERCIGGEIHLTHRSNGMQDYF